MQGDVRHLLTLTFLNRGRPVAPKCASAIRAWDGQREHGYLGHWMFRRQILTPWRGLIWVRSIILSADPKPTSYRNLTPYLASKIYHVYSRPDAVAVVIGRTRRERLNTQN